MKVRSEAGLVVSRDALSNIYHIALVGGRKDEVIGFLLGDLYGGGFRFSLPVAILGKPEDFCRKAIVSQFKKRLSPAQALAQEFETALTGVFLAWDESDHPDRNEIAGRFADSAVELGLPRLMLIPIDGAETIWSPRVYFAAAFSSGPQNYQADSRESDSPLHNHRRINARWKELAGGLG